MGVLVCLFFSCSRLPCRTPHYSYWSCLLSSLFLAVSHFPYVHDLDSLGVLVKYFLDCSVSVYLIPSSAMTRPHNSEVLKFGQTRFGFLERIPSALLNTSVGDTYVLMTSLVMLTLVHLA